MKSILCTIFLFAGIFTVFSQEPDSLIFINGDNIDGEIKNMKENILYIETDYSDEDFTIEWDKIRKIFTKTYFLVSLSNGDRFNGHLKSVSADSVSVIADNGETVNVDLDDIVILESVEENFWHRIYASVDVGFDLTKANNFKQLSTRSNLGYLAERWQLDGTYNLLFSKQEGTDDIKRTEGGATFKYLLPHDWYPLFSMEFLSNNEQQIDLRWTSRWGMGKYLIHTNKAYLGFSGGISHNREDYLDAALDRDSWEVFIGTALNIFNIGDLKLFAQWLVFPSLTEANRWRSDFKFDFKYDLPLDFYIKMGYTLNYDNQPAPGSMDTDYVLFTGFGWEW